MKPHLATLEYEPQALTDGRYQGMAVDDELNLTVEPQVGIAALEWARAERLDLLVEALADARDLGARHPQPERLDHLVDLPGRDAGDLVLLDDRHQRLLTSLARLEEGREVAAAPELRDRELGLAARVSQRRPR